MVLWWMRVHGNGEELDRGVGGGGSAKWRRGLPAMGERHGSVRGDSAKDDSSMA